MNIRYTLGRFEAEFSSDFQNDLDAVKGAGFKPDTSTGRWVWWTSKIAVIEKLKKKRPLSGLTATPEAAEAIRTFTEIEERNRPIREAAEKLKKEQKKKQKADQQEEVATHLVNIPDGKIGIGPEDLPYKAPYVSTFVKPSPPDLRCSFCQDPVYEGLERTIPFPVCMWCEKTLLDVHVTRQNSA
jgi:hypothetical protein